jgi:hypothetical protein
MLKNIIKKVSFTQLITISSLLIILFFSVFITYLDFHREFDHDEFQHIHIAWCLKNGMILYKDCFDHHAPLYSIINSIIWKTIHLPDSFSTLFTFRLINLFFIWGILIVTFQIAKKIFDAPTAWISSTLLLTSYTFLRKAMEIRPDAQMTFLWLFGLLFLINYFSQKKNKYVLITSICFICASFFHFKSLIPICIFTIGFFISTYPPRNKKLFVLGSVATILILMILSIIIFQGNFLSFIKISSSGFRDVLLGISFNRGVVPYFPLFYEQRLAEIGLWILAAGTLGCYKRTIVRYFGISTLISTLIIFLLHRYAQWYIMVIPCFAILVAGGGTHLINSNNAFLRKSSIVFFLFSICIGISSTIYALSVYPNNKTQIEFTNYVLKKTQPTDKILTVWSNKGGYMFRPHATYSWYQTDGTNLNIPTTSKEYLSKGIVNDISKYQPTYVILDTPNPIILDFVKKYFPKTKYPYFFGPAKKIPKNFRLKLVDPLTEC